MTTDALVPDTVTTPVSEPGTLLFVGTGLAGAGAWSRTRWFGRRPRRQTSSDRKLTGRVRGRPAHRVSAAGASLLHHRVGVSDPPVDPMKSGVKLGGVVGSGGERRPPTSGRVPSGRELSWGRRDAASRIPMEIVGTLWSFAVRLPVHLEISPPTSCASRKQLTGEWTHPARHANCSEPRRYACAPGRSAVRRGDVKDTPCPMKRLSASSNALPSALEGYLGESLLGSGAGKASGGSAASVRNPLAKTELEYELEFACHNDTPKRDKSPLSPAVLRSVGGRADQARELE